MEEGVSDRKDDKNEKNDEEKEAECLDDTIPFDMEEGVKDINDEVKNEGETTDSESTTMDEGKGVNNEKVGENVDLDELDESTCYDDKYYDIYDNEEENIQKILFFG